MKEEFSLPLMYMSMCNYFILLLILIKSNFWSIYSVEMLTEDQISSLMMEPDMNQVCQEILGTPLVEVCPLLQQLQQQ